MYSHIVRKHLNLPLSAVLLGLTLFTAASVTPSLLAQKRRIAVVSLDVSPDAKKAAMTQFGIQNDLGASLSDLIINKLVADGKFIVIERAALDKLIKEQNFSNSDRADQNTAVKLGKLAGVDAIVIGSITQFGGEQEKSKFSVPGGKFNPFGQGVSTSKSTVNVGVTARLIDVTTGVILSSATGAGTSTKSKTGATTNVAAYDTTSKDFGSTSVGDATTQAIAQVVKQIEAAPMPTAAPPPPVVHTAYTGVIADVSGSTLILTVGTSAGVRIGDTVEITRPSRTVKNPTTGAVVRVISDKLGEARITEADATSSVASYSGTAIVKVKDTVSSQP